MIIVLHKPYGMLSQFTPEKGSAWNTLAELDLPKGVYPIGRLDIYKQEWTHSKTN